MKAIQMVLKKPLTALLLPALLVLGTVLATAEEKAEEPPLNPLNVDNLVPVEESAMHAAYIDPDADFSVFKRVAILEPYVAFRSNWQRDQNRSRTNRVSARDMDRIKRDVATLFERVFTESLENGGYEVVTVAGDDVLVLRPAIIDLDITAPDTRSAGRTRTFSASAGAATIFIELVDSVTGDVIGRAADRQTARNAGSFVTHTNSVTNTADATRMMRRWSDRLVAFLDSHYK